MTKPDNVLHWRSILKADDRTYDGDDEKLSIASDFADKLRLFRLGVAHVLLPPGRRTSWPHAERSEDEFVYVIEGTPDLWQDGTLHRLEPGDGVGWPAGTGIAHTLLNNTATDVQLLVVGESSRSRYEIHYPLHPARNKALGEHAWADPPARALGPHDGLPDALRKPNT